MFAINPCRVDVSTIPAASVRARIVNLNAAIAFAFWAFNHVGNSLLSNIGLTFYWNACNRNVALAAKKMMRYAPGMEQTSHTDLKNWLKDNDLTQRKFAAMLSERDEQISRWINGKVRPEKYARMYIELETLGAVRADGWP